MFELLVVLIIIGILVLIARSNLTPLNFNPPGCAKPYVQTFGFTCHVPPKGNLPDLCGGGVSRSGSR